MKTTKIRLVAALSILALALSGCASGGSTSSSSGQESTASDIKTAITAQFPNCNFEVLTVETGKLYPVRDDSFNKAYLTYGINEFDYEGEGESTAAKFRGAGASPLYEVCNTKGLKLDTVTATNSIYGKTLEEETGQKFCWIPGRAPTKSEKSVFQKCEKRIETKSRLGFWFVIHEFEDRESAEKLLKKQLGDMWGYGYAHPVLFAGKFAISANGSFDDVNQATIDEFDLGWLKIAEVLGADNMGSLIEGYPNSFDKGKWSDSTMDYSYSEGSRLDINLAYKRLERYLTCNGSLKVSELSFTPGQCGKAHVEVFQSDLATGKCNFLAYWKDQSGAKKIGVFEYCNAFQEGSISEDAEYNLKVRVVGTTSYQTKLGYENEVLSFSVVGDY